MNELYIDPVVKKELDRIKDDVYTKDRDFVMVIDGEEGCGKSVLGQQIGKYLDPHFTMDNITFNSTQFLEAIKKTRKRSCIILDEAYSSASARGALTEINRSMVAVATEMRQRNLFVIIIMPSFFDLDKYFALWRCRCLFHVYFSSEGKRGRYVLFPKTAKKMLYLLGKKFYNYNKPRSPYPVCRFNNFYTVDEKEYRLKKQEAFRKRTISNMAKRWKGQRDSYINFLYHNQKIASKEIADLPSKWGERPLSQREIQKIVILGDV